jgi:hypothetical protein
MLAGGLGQYSQQALLAKAEDGIGADDQVVEHLDLHGRGFQHQGPGQYLVLLGWLHVAIGGVVGKYQGCHATSQGRLDDAPGINGGPVDGTLLQSLDAIPQEAIGGVQVPYLEDLMRERADFDAPKARQGTEVGKRVTLLGRLLEVEARMRRGVCSAPVW